MSVESATTQADPHVQGVRPGRGYRWLRRALQAIALCSIVVAPFLGGFQRSERAAMATWDARGFDLAPALRAALPGGEPAQRAYELNQVLGGGSAADYLGVALMDPLAGGLTLMRGAVEARTLLAWLLPIALALFAGRAFCGWLCPYGTLARWLDAALSLLPFRHRIALPKRRPLRYVLAIAAVGGSFYGVHLLLYVTLPYLLLQHAAYAAWLLGGGSAALGLLIGLLLAGVVLGPATYCATLCPTGAVLALLGRARRVHLTLAAPAQCGSSCVLCSRACWLGLDPASGDPGPDCDLCARCAAICPRTNMIVTVARPARRHLPVITTVALALAGAGAWGMSPAHAQSIAGPKPRLVLDRELQRAETTLAISVIDQTGVELVSQDGADVGSELSVFLARGARGQADEQGRLPGREIYEGPLVVEIEHAGRTTRVPFERPNSPRSTDRRSIYRTKLALSLDAGDSVSVQAIAGWLEPGARFTVNREGTRPSPTVFWGYVLAGFMTALGALALSLSIPMFVPVSRRARAQRT